jgi:uncharacterized protein YyaL (SSP411 family)
MAEGAFYVWTKREFDELLGEDADIAATYWNVRDEGNVDARHDIQGELEEQVIPYLFPSEIECIGNGPIVLCNGTKVR